jgi:ABC-type Fe3+-hydroxamate transport system substrate-binding protein
MPGRFLLVPLAAIVVLGAACGARSEPIAAVPAAVVTVPDGDGGTVRVRPSAGPTITTDAGAAATLRALGAPVELVAVDDVVARLTAEPLPRMAVLAPGVETPAGVPVLRWSLTDPDVAGELIARLGLAAGKPAEGIRLARTVDAGVRTSLAGAATAPATKVLVEGTAARSLGGLVQRLNAAPVGFSGIAAAARDKPDVWLVTPGTPRTLSSLRKVDELKAVAAVREKRFEIVDPASFTPSPDLPARLAALVALLHPPVA